MTRSIDPFEEYLRKKKVELLEQQYREQLEESRQAEEAEADESERFPTVDEDPETEARLREEMDDFFESGQVAAAELFNKASGLDEEKVEEIKDALDEVFEEDVPVPQTDPDGDTFVEFFHQIKQDYDSGRRGPQEFTRPVTPPEVKMLRTEEPPVVEAVTGITALPIADDFAGPAELEPDLPPEPPVPPVPPAVEEVSVLPESRISEREPAAEAVSSTPLPFRDDFTATAAEVSSEDPTDSVPPPRVSDRLNLAEILLGGAEEIDLERKVEVLCRVLAKLVERAGLTQSELIEALIKSDVEF